MKSLFFSFQSLQKQKSLVFQAAFLKMRPKRIAVNTNTLKVNSKAIKYLSKTFRPMCQKFCPFWPQTFHMRQKAPKKSSKAAYLVRETAPFFNLHTHFLNFFVGLLKRMPCYLKVEMRKRRRYQSIREG